MEIFIQLVTAMTTAMDVGLAVPQMACRNKTSRIDGTLIIISASRIIRSLIRFPARPLTVPYTTAMTVDRLPDSRPM